MIPRTVWFLAGAGAGIYAVSRARRLAEAFTPDGLADRLSGLSVGVRLFADEVRAGAAAKESQLRAHPELSERGTVRAVVRSDHSVGEAMEG